MRRAPFALAAALIVACHPAPIASQHPAASLEADMDRFVSTALGFDAVAGAAVAIVTPERAVYSKGFGYADIETKRRIDEHTPFYVASTTKSFTGLAGAMLHHKGDIDLDRPVSSYLPDLRLDARLNAGEITARDLLLMTHGIRGGGPITFRTSYSGEYTPELLLTLAARHAPLPDRGFNYSNIGYVLYGLVLERHREGGWRQTLQDEVFAPLGMASTSAYVSNSIRDRSAQPHAFSPGSGLSRRPMLKDSRNMHPAGGHMSTLMDLSRYLRAHLGGGSLDGKQVLPAEAVRATHRPHVPQNRVLGSITRHAWGLGWDIGRYNGQTVVHRPGSFDGYVSHVSFMPDRGVGVVVLLNTGSVRFADLVMTYAYDRFLGAPGFKETHARKLEEYGRSIQAAPATTAGARDQPGLDAGLARCAGRYENDDMGTIEIAGSGAHLTAAAGVARSPLTAADGGRVSIRLDGSAAEVTFARDPDGSCTGLTWRGYRFARAR